MPVATYEQVLARLAVFTDAQRSLAHSPEPPHKSYASDCRAGGSCGLSGLGELPRDKWRSARFRLARELKQLAGVQLRWSNEVARLVEVEGGSL